MKKILLAASIVFSITAVVSYAQTQAVMTESPEQAQNLQNANSMPLSFQTKKWVSKNPTDEIIIQNGSSDALVIDITVDKTTPKSAGLMVKNCGSTTAIAAGNSAICSTHDAANPVTFSSDSSNTPASGSYQIKRQ
jgi:hypothetical protein